MAFVAVASQVIAIGKQLLGHSAPTACPDQPTALAVQTALTRAPADQLARFRVLWAAANPSLPLTATSYESIARAIAGGADCTPTSATGIALKAFGLPFVRQYGDVAPGSSGGLGETIGGILGGIGDAHQDATSSATNRENVKALLIVAAAIAGTIAVVKLAKGR